MPVISTFDSLTALPADILALAIYPRQKELFDCIDWFQCLNKTVLSGERNTKLYVARNDVNIPLGLLACSNPLQTRDLRGLTNYYALDYRPVVFIPEKDDDTRKALIQSFVHHIAAERPRWHQADFDYLRSDRPDARFLQEALRSHGFMTVLSHQYDNWYLDSTNMEFESYFAARSSQLRNTITRKEKKIKKTHRLDIKIYTQNDAALTQAIDAWIAIYNSSWKQPEPYPDFIPTFIRMCADLSMLRLGVAYLDDKAAAAQLWINSNERAIIYKLAYDEAFAELSVGAVLSRELFRNAIDVDHVKEIDYGIGSESYKREWMSGVRHMNRISAYNLRTTTGALRAGKKLAGAAINRIAALRRKKVNKPETLPVSPTTPPPSDPKV